MDQDSEDLDFEHRFSPEGRLLQVEYATEATFNTETAIGMRGCDGFVLAVEKIKNEPLLDTSVQRNVFTIDDHIGAVFTGLMADAIRIVSEARTCADYFRRDAGLPASIEEVMQNVSAYMQENTLRSDRRPLGACVIFGEYTGHRSKIFCIEPSGAFEAYNGFAIGEAAEEAKFEMGEIDFPSTSIEQLVNEATKIIYMVHEHKDDFDLEISWCGQITNGQHMPVPPDVLEAAKIYAREQSPGPSNSKNI